MLLRYVELSIILNKVQIHFIKLSLVLLTPTCSKSYGGLNLIYSDQAN